MKNIHVGKKKQQSTLFEIKGYTFFEFETDLSPVPIYRLTVKRKFDSMLDVRFWFEEMNGDINFLTDTPSELTTYIKEYEENIPFKDRYLFHDLRTRYIEFCVYDEGTLKDNVLLVGYTLLENEVCFAIKAFSLIGLEKFTRLIFDYCNKHQITVNSEDNLRWIQLEQCLLPDINVNRNDLFDGFLKKTMLTDYCKIFIDAFKCIDSQGYLDRKFYDGVVRINGNETTIGKLKQFTKYFSRFWKTEISTKNVKRTVLSLHDELLNEESIDKMVYTIKPHLMQYYQLHWFEDFCSENINNFTSPGCKIVNSYCGRKFNFFQSGTDNDSRELDILLGMESNGIHKIVAIECKKKLSNDEIKTTNSKIKKKILSAPNNVIDAYIHIGCFNEDVVFDKTIESTDQKYKQGLIQLKKEAIDDAPYFAFNASSSENLNIKFYHVIKEIFEQW